MLNYEYKHTDSDASHDETLTLHDCISEKICLSDNVLRFYFSDGFWIIPRHTANNLNKIVRTDEAVVDFLIENIDEISIRVFKRNIFKKTYVLYWEITDLINAINKKNYTIEFIEQYRSYNEQLWHCIIRSKNNRCYYECQLHLPNAVATYYWNNLRPNCIW